MHALVWWGFLVITIGTVEMLIDGLAGTERILSFMGGFYNVVIASGDILAAIVILASIVFLVRRYLVKPRRFEGEEMKPSSKYDATLILVMILLLMVTLLGLNIGYLKMHAPHHAGSFPVSQWLLDVNAGSLLPDNVHAFERANWWAHIVLVLVFLNILPYSKHFHVILAVPNVFLSRLQPKARLNTMDSIKKELELMMNPDTAADTDAGAEDDDVPERFGVKDAEDASWKNLMDAYTCTECGRCTAVCPANLTGKKLSPRKLYVDLRKRMGEKTNGLLKEGKDFDDGKSLVGDYITEEELWACTSCMACIEECPVNIDHVPFIMDMRRNLVMEETKTSPELNNMFSNIANNGAPWPYNQEDRPKWAEGVELMTTADMQFEGKDP
jgi:heterodisulfide reductase subunit C/nitrate reductase gamma subunit